MIELKDGDLFIDSRTSSKGNQMKWHSEDGMWYKADYLGYEGLSEYVCSNLLKSSSLQDNEYVLYDTCSIKYKKSVFKGCVSNNFLGKGESLITLERLYSSMFHKSFLEAVFSIDDHTARLEYIVNTVKHLTGINDFGIYLAKLMTVDALFLNDDRHLHNVAVIRKTDGSFRTCPVFDIGAGLLSDTTIDYPIGEDIDQLIKECKPKTFCESFDEQLEICEKLYGRQVKFEFSRNDVISVLNKEEVYDKETKERVYDIIMEQRRRYSYLFN